MLKKLIALFLVVGLFAMSNNASAGCITISLLDETGAVVGVRCN